MRRRLDLLPQPPPPPLFGEIGGGIPETTNDGGSSSSSESSKGNLNPSVIIISLILMAVLLFSILLHLLLRYLSGSSSSSSSDHHLPSTDHAPRISSRRVSPEYHQSLIDSLPLFSLNSVIRLKNSSPVDCAVCLSKLEPHDQLRLLPLCCHAFHARCIDTWLASNPTCPLCRSTIRVDESEEMAKLSSGGDSFRLEIGSVSRGSTSAAAVDSGGIPNSRRSYSMGSYEYVVEEDSEVVVVGSMQQQGASGNNHGQKDINCETSPGPANVAVPEPPGAQVAAEVGGGGGGGRSWLKDFVDRLSSSASSSFTSPNLSYRFSGRNFTGSSRLSDVYQNGDGMVTGIGEVGSWDLEGNWVSEEMSSFFRWLSGV